MCSNLAMRLLLLGSERRRLILYASILAVGSLERLGFIGVVRHLNLKEQMVDTRINVYQNLYVKT